MKSKTWLSRLIQLATVISVTSVITYSALSQNAPGEVKSVRDEVTLQIAVVLNAPVTTLACTASNNGQQPVMTTVSIGIFGNELVVVKPSGEEIVIQAASGLVQAFELEPNQAATWYVSLEPLQAKNPFTPYFSGELYSAYRDVFNETGLYQVYWTLRRNEVSKQGVQHRSNDVFIFKKDSPPKSE